jgi:hypothetical protein
MTNCAETARTPDEQQLIDVAAILAAGILRLRERDSLPESKQTGNPAESAADRLELNSPRVRFPQILWRKTCN